MTSNDGPVGRRGFLKGAAATAAAMAAELVDCFFETKAGRSVGTARKPRSRA